MSKKPDLVFLYERDGDPVYIIARHEKGAKSAARANGIVIGRSEHLEKVSAAYALEAINARD